MPHVKLHTIQACPASWKKLRIRVPSRSNPGVEYTVDVSFVEGTVSCTCPGFPFKKKCHHTGLEESPCGWSEDAGPEVQTSVQCSNRECPRCGGHTIDVVVGGGSEDVLDAVDDEAAMRASGIKIPAPGERADVWRQPPKPRVRGRRESW